MIKKPTEEQKKVIEYNGNSVVTANPGSGKTYTVVEKIGKVLEELPDYKGIIAISFTNKASDELKKRCKLRNINNKQSFFGTIDKFYISQIIIPFACHITNSIAEYKVISSVEEEPAYTQLKDLNGNLSQEQEQLLIKSLREGMIFLDILGQTALYILKNVPGVLKYMKARYSHIFIDEYQDCGQIQHEIFIELCDNGLTGIAVGDVNQAIYGFDKRFPKYLISLIGKENFRHFKLSKNHRCDPSITEYSLCLFGASKQIINPKRVFKVNIEGNEYIIASKIDQYLDKIKEKYGVRDNNKVAILCRGKKTIELLDRALKTNHKIYVDTPLDTDSSDWGRLFRNILLAKFDDEEYAVDYAESLFSDEIEPEKYRVVLKACNNIFSAPMAKMDLVLEDFIIIAKLVFPKGKNAESVILLKKILQDEKMLFSFSPAGTNEINIMTLHKSKGLEFNIVFHMDMYQYVISDDYGTKEEIQQLLNLHYVGVTRAIDVCYIMNGSQRFIKSRGEFGRANPSKFLFKSGLSERRQDVTW